MDFQEFLDGFLSGALKFAVNVILAAAAFYIGLKLIKFIKKTVGRHMEKRGKLDKSVRSFLVSIMGIALVIGLAVLILNIFNVQTVSFAAVLASAGLAIGLALQGSLSNFAGGFLILVLKPFRHGDFIEINGTMGTVEDMDIFYTKLNTFDNKKVVIPNSIIINNTLVNYSAKDERRIDLKIGVAYDSSIEEVKKVIRSAAQSNKFILDDPSPVIRLGELSASSIVFHIQVWCRTKDYWEAFYGLTEEVKDALDKNNIKIPYQQIDMHVKKDLS
jgi:small conductance mechanosensitive channel